jgi:hypothetical protein
VWSVFYVLDTVTGALDGLDKTCAMATSGNRRRRSSHTSASIDAAAQTQQSERAQAERFSEMLRRELAELTEKLVAAEARWLRRCEASGYVDPPERVALVRRRITDLERMLKALGARFPRT